MLHIRSKMPALTSLLALLLLLPGCATHTAPPAPPVSPFAATGLTTHPYETAEELLARAHKMDGEAATLVSAGYSLGVGGFPKDRGLGLSWMFQVRGNYSFLSALNDADYPAQRLLGSDLAECEASRNSDLAARFRQAGLFDIDQCCRELEAAANKTPDWTKSYQERRKSLEREEADLSSVWQELRHMRAGQVSTASEHSWNMVDNLSLIPSTMLPYAGMEPGPDGETRVWSEERHLEFMLHRPRTNLDLIKALRDMLNERLAWDHSPPLEFIRRAHGGDPVAVRAMAANYARGGMGFPWDPALAFFWMNRGVRLRDPVSMVQMAVSQYPNYVLIWILTSEVLKQQNSPVHGLALRLKQWAEANGFDPSRPDLEEYRAHVLDGAPFFTPEPRPDEKKP